MYRLPLLVLSLLLVSCASNPEVAEVQPENAPPLHLKLIGLNDFHGHLEGPSGQVDVGETRVSAGGAAELAATIDLIRKYHPNTVVVGAGDMIGASPLISALFHDEPAIDALDIAGLQINAVGNHEFDEGMDELERMQNGGCHPVDGCNEGGEFDGASFRFLAANVAYEASGETVFPAYEIREFEGIKVGFIGLTLEGTPGILEPGAADGLVFADEAETINAATAELQEKGVETIVVLIHEGGYPAAKGDPSGCDGISGPILEIVEKTDRAVDAFVTGHTHQPYVCTIDSRLVTSAKAYGQVVTEIDLFIDRRSKDVSKFSARNIIVTQTSAEHAEMSAHVAKYAKLVEPLADRVIGSISADVSRERNDSGESPMGSLIADMQLAYTRTPERGAAVIAFMNPGGVRGTLEMAPSGREETGEVRYAEAHAVQPFGNKMITITLTGSELHELLEAQWKGQKYPRILHVSRGFTYEWSKSAEPGQKVDPASMKLDGQTIDPDAEYRITANSYIANGGDNFEIFERGRDRLVGPVDLVAFERFFELNSSVAPPTDVRVKMIE